MGTSGSKSPTSKGLDNETQRAGLCARCRHCRRIVSDRGSVFYLCRRAAQEPEYPKYPRLPVLTCRGFEPESPAASAPPLEQDNSGRD